MLLNPCACAVFGSAAIFLRGRRRKMEPGGVRREKVPPLPPPQQATPPKIKDGPSSRLEKAKQRAAQQELKQRQRAEASNSYASKKIQ
ncbi:small vasohibin-binding protein isoform X2 [Rhineura floridana]|uniref:small vasohibin-binding protein isoform X2 n=1 Tax=Rhineura floridana TaxID=261503 RepID=UPI002AC84F13|nr:small vasohibin-binding protein isoform X2 [Rhineura floridana]